MLIKNNNLAIIFQSDFETIPLNSDSLPANWLWFDDDGINPAIKWAVRDTSGNFGGNTRPRASGRRSLEIPWYAGRHERLRERICRDRIDSRSDE